MEVPKRYIYLDYIIVTEFKKLNNYNKMKYHIYEIKCNDIVM